VLDLRQIMRRCHELAKLGVQGTSPNPIVGTVILDGQSIIGEGWHEKYGEAHAEINALNSVQTKNLPRISKSALFVSLEPCSIHGNTPPCTTAILESGIQKVVISSRDNTPGVAGISEYVLNDKVEDLIYGIDHQLGDRLAAPRNVYIAQKRPYIILKWAQSKDGFIGRTNEPIAISNEYTKRYVHKLRSEVGAIVVGSNTVRIDNPSLTTRYFYGKSPLRVVFGSINIQDYKSLKLITDEAPVLIMSTSSQESIQSDTVSSVLIDAMENFHKKFCDEMYNRRIQKVLIEGGATTLQRLIDDGLWDECQIITAPKEIEGGVKAPILLDQEPTQSFNILGDSIKIYHNPPVS